MRKHSLFVLCLLLVSCGPKPDLIPEIQYCAVLDFTEYSKLGFLITTEAYVGEYESVGILDCFYQAGAHRQEADIRISHDAWSEWGRSIRSRPARWIPDALDEQAILKIAHEEATRRGGNAIMNFRVTYDYATYPSLLEPTIYVPTMEIHGFIIRRLD